MTTDRASGLGLRTAAAMFLLGPAAIHFAAVPEHLRAYVLYGLLFILLGLVQAGLAVAVIFRPSALVLLGGAGLTLLVIGIWLLSRTTGVPIAPVPWRPEAVGMPDLLVTIMEWVAAVLMLLADSRLERGRTFRTGRVSPGLALAAVVTLAFTVVGLAAIGSAPGH
jgi:hypothetical protein